MNTNCSETLRRWDDEHVWHPFTPMQAYRDEAPPIIERGDGFFLFDTDGNRYLDGISALWCNVHGHRVPEIDHAVRGQLESIAHSTLLGLANVPSIELARRLVEVTPAGLSKVFYSDAGATAVEAALKIAVQYHHLDSGGRASRTLFARLDGAYHGDTLGSVSVGRMEAFHRPFEPLLFETVRVPAPVAFRTPPGFDARSYLAFCFDELERIIVEHHDRLAAFVIEPLVQGAAGILVHPTGYLKRVRELTAGHGVLLIADEVAVGFGRTGTLFACEQEAVRPDLLCLAKGLSGGYLPLAATLATDEIYNAFLEEGATGVGASETRDRRASCQQALPKLAASASSWAPASRTFFHGHTYTGNPLGCAAALASLDLFERNYVLENVHRNSRQLAERLKELADHPHVGEIRQKGVMVGIELVRDRRDNSPFPAGRRTGHLVALAARRRGVLVRPLGDVVVLMPAPAMPPSLIDPLCDAAIEAIDEATQ